MYFKLHELTLFLEFKSKPCSIFFLRCLQQFNFDLFLSTSFQEERLGCLSLGSIRL